MAEGGGGTEKVAVTRAFLRAILASMKTLFTSLLCLVVLGLSSARAADNAALAAVQAADDARVAAMTSAGRDALNAILSDDLRYSHSSGNVDTKASFIEALTTGKLKYASIQGEERNFTFPAPGIALMTGRAHVRVVNATSEVDMLLGDLAVWREEGGKWRFLAWQSAKLPAPKAP